MLQQFGKFSLKQFKPSVPPTSEARRIGREHFIPVRPAELVQQLLGKGKLDASQEATFRSLCSQLERFFHNEIRCSVRRLQELYALVGPDQDTERLTHVDRVRRETTISDLFDGLAALLERANFRRLSSQELEEAIGCASELGVRLHVDLDSFQRLEVYARGEAAVRHTKRSWRNAFRVVESEIAMYQRLVVVFRLGEEELEQQTVNTAYMKLFKNVPKKDVDMTLPGARVRISLLDQGKIILPTLSGIGITGLKIFKGALLLAFAGFYGLLAVIGLIGGAIGSGLKSVNGYVRTRNKYELSLARNLHYQNLDNNAGVLLRIASEAEAQEVREAILAYFVLLTNEGTCCPSRFQDEAEALLRECGVDIAFETDDALDKLERLRLCQRSDDQSLAAVSLETAVGTVMNHNLQAALTG